MAKYKTMTQAKKRIRSIINNVEINKEFLNDELISLLLHHPDRRVTKKEDVEYLVVKYHQQWISTRALYIKTKGREEDSVSWNHCIRNLFGKFDNQKRSLKHIQQAFREEIEGTSRREYFYTKLDDVEKKGLSWHGTCEQCKVRGIITSDHKTYPFKMILRDFLNQEQKKMDDVRVHDVDGVYRIVDRDFADKWITFHDEKAEWQFLCHSCNSHNGTYGY